MGDKIIVIDEERELPNQELYEFVKKTYWVISFKDKKCSTDDWLMSRGRPIDVPNGMMVWRRPTFEEFTDYLRKWTVDENAARTGYLSKYRRGPVVPLLCKCGHGEDSHWINRFMGNKMNCRMTCPCHVFRPVEEE